VQRLVDGSIQLTPLFDFAPMYLDPELIVRGCVWRDASGKRQDSWIEVLETLDVDDVERGRIAAALLAFAPVVGDLERTAVDCGVEPAVIEQCKGTIEAQAGQLLALAAMAPAHRSPAGDGPPYG
jgi:serine/threonine-protein kinase HipA